MTTLPRKLLLAIGLPIAIVGIYFVSYRSLWVLAGLDASTIDVWRVSVGGVVVGLAAIVLAVAILVKNAGRKSE